MRLVLIYDGPLPSNGNSKIKHEIRKQFHPQLKEHWRVDSTLRAWLGGQLSVPAGYQAPNPNRPVKGFNFLPLVIGTDLQLVCSLDITFFAGGRSR